MAKGGFTDAFLKSLQPQEGRYTVYEKDPRFEGFAVEVLPSGKLSFRYRYRLRGKREKVTIGSYPKMSLAVARERYREMIDAVHRGISPAQEKKRLRAGSLSARTFGDLARDWIESELRPANKNARQDERYIEAVILPLIGGKELGAVTRSDLWDCIEIKKKNGKLQAARRVRSILKRIFAYASSRGELAFDPAAGINPKHVGPTRARDRVLSADEIPVWLHAIETSGISRQLKLAFRLLLLVPVRKGELLSARWSNIDLSGKTWDIPKEDSKNGTPLRYRLSDQVTAIFQQLHELAAGSEWVLPSSRGFGRQPISKTTLNKALSGISGLPQNAVIHDLRRTIRTNLAELGVPINVAELCLNHRPTGIKKVYDRSELLDQRHEALLRWEKRLQFLLTPSASLPSDGGEVETLLERLRGDEALKRYVLQQILSLP